MKNVFALNFNVLDEIFVLFIMEYPLFIVEGRGSIKTFLEIIFIVGYQRLELNISYRLASMPAGNSQKKTL